MIDQILEQAGLKYEDLNQEEKKTLQGWLKVLSQNELTIDLVRNYIVKMKASVETDITTTSNNNKQDIFLKARLKNYLLLEAFLNSPIEAKKALEASITGIKLDRK